VPCANAVDQTSGSCTSFGTTGAYCMRTSSTISGWQCSNTDGRTIQVNNVAVTCGSMPLPAAWSDGYYYFSMTAGTYTYACIGYW
jgi:hypothetical protein